MIQTRLKQSIMFFGLCTGIVVVFKEFDFALALGIILVSGVLMAVISGINDRIQTNLAYNKIIEPLYVISRHPKTNEEFECGILSEFVIWSKYKKVTEEIEHQQFLLHRSKNPFMDEKLTERQKIAVIPLIFQDGVHVNESWKQFRKRCIQYIKDTRAERHAYLKQSDDVWYMKFSNNQSVEWEKK